MSKLYKNYISLKVQDCSKCYLFKSGFFYIFLDDDAKMLAPLLNLKLSNLNSTIVKCGFPTNSLNKYLEKLKDTEFDVHIVCDNDFTSSIDVYDFVNNISFNTVIDKFLSTNIDTLSISQAFDLLYDLQKKFTKIKLENNREKKK